MNDPIDIIATAKGLWKWRLPMAIALLGIVGGGVARLLTQPSKYRASTIIAAPQPQAYLEVDPVSRRVMDFPGINKRALIRHAKQLSASDWASETLSVQFSVSEAAALARTVRARVVRTDGKSDFALELSLEAAGPVIAADAANVLADAYVSDHRSWEVPEMQAALTAVRRREQQIQAAGARAGRDLAAAVEGELPDYDVEARVRLLSHLTSADALTQQAQLDAAAARRRIVEALNTAGVASDEAAALAGELAEATLPDELDEVVVSHERELARSLLDVPASDVDMPIPGADSLVLPDEQSWRDAMWRSLAQVVGPDTLAALQMPAMVDHWLGARRAVARANALAEVRDRLRRQIADQALRGQRSEELLREDRDLRVAGLSLERAEEMLVAGIADPTTVTQLTVVGSATPPRGPSRAGLVRGLATVVLLGATIALCVGLALETFAPSRECPTAGM